MIAVLGFEILKAAVGLLGKAAVGKYKLAPNQIKIHLNTSRFATARPSVSYSKKKQLSRVWLSWQNETRMHRRAAEGERGKDTGARHRQHVPVLASANTEALWRKTDALSVTKS